MTSAGCCFQNMHLMMQIVVPIHYLKKCFTTPLCEDAKGLPLATKLLGGLLRSKTNVHEWRKILNNNMWDFQDDRGLHVLKVTYYCLPQRQ